MQTSSAPATPTACHMCPRVSLPLISFLFPSPPTTAFSQPFLPSYLILLLFPSPTPNLIVDAAVGQLRQKHQVTAQRKGGGDAAGWWGDLPHMLRQRPMVLRARRLRRCCDVLWRHCSKALLRGRRSYYNGGIDVSNAGNNACWSCERCSSS